MQATANTYIKFIDFRTLDKWYVSYYINPHNLKSSFKFTKLKDLIKPVKDKIKLKDYKGDLRVVKKISFNDGKIHLREENETKMDLYTLNPNDLLVSKINFHQGALAINKNEKIVCTTHYQPYSINRNLILDEYLIMVLRNKKFQNYLDFLRADGIKNEATYEFIGELEIPLPSIKEQEALVRDYHKKTKEAESLSLQANNLESEIEKYIFSELGVIEKKEKAFSKKIRLVNSANIERWGVEFILDSNSSQLLESNKYNNEPLKSIVQINPTTNFPKQNLPISFLPMECISDEYGEVIEFREKQTSEAKGYTKFMEGDLVWARITPCMQNGKSAIVKNLRNNLGCGSTEYHVIRNINSAIELEYIYHLLRLKTVLSKAMSHFTGSAGQQRVPRYFLEDLLIPVPPYKVQKTISDNVNAMKLLKKQNQMNAESLKEKAEQEFEQSIFS